MTGQEHYRPAGEFAEKARDRLSRGDNQGAIACAAVAQTHASLVNVPEAKRGSQKDTLQLPPDWKGMPSGPIRSPARHNPEPGQ